MSGGAGAGGGRRSLTLTGGGTSDGAGRGESFARGVFTSLAKAINNRELPAKQKHIRIAVMSTHREGGGGTYWGIVTQMGLQANDVTAWKFAHVTHVVLRDGHPNCLRDATDHVPFLDSLSLLWSKMTDGYGKCVASYCDMLVAKINFHAKNPSFPGNLDFEDITTYDREYASNVDNLFTLSVDLFDYMEAVLTLQLQMFRVLERGRMSASPACLLAPLVPVIQDACQLYDFSVRSMFKLFASVPRDVLQGHEKRFNDMFPVVKKFFDESARLTYVKSFLQLPYLNAKPDFSRVINTTSPTAPAQQHYAPVKLIHHAADHDPAEHSQATAAGGGDLIDIGGGGGASGGDSGFFLPPPTRSPPPVPPLPASEYSNQQQQATSPAHPGDPTHPYMEKLDYFQAEIARLLRVNNELRMTHAEREHEFNTQISEIHSKFIDLKSENQQLKSVASGANDTIERLEAELSSKTQELEGRLRASTEKLSKMADIYAKLRHEHIELLKAKGELQRQLAGGGGAAAGGSAAAAEGEQPATVQQQQQLAAAESGLQLAELRREAAELTERLANSDAQLAQAADHNAQLTHSLHSVQASLDHALLLSCDVGRLLQRQVREAVAEVETPSVILPSLIPGQASMCVERLGESLHTAQSPQCKSVALALNMHQCACLLASALHAAHTTSSSQREDVLGDWRRLGESFCALAQSCFLDRPSEGGGQDALEGEVAADVARLLHSVRQLESGDVSSSRDMGEELEEEMRAASRAIDEASRNIQEVFSNSAAGDISGEQLKVHTTVFDACSHLMSLIKQLMLAVKDMQDEIVASEGGDVSTSRRFYSANGAWTEGLISGGKSLGLAATMLLSAADAAVSGTGRFVALEACARQSAAATAHLVMATRVKAGSSSESARRRVQQLSRQVQAATGQVVASARHADTFTQESSLMDFSGLSLHQAKQLEMEANIKVLELEAEVERERRRLGQLRKTHYDLQRGDQQQLQQHDPAAAVDAAE